MRGIFAFLGLSLVGALVVPANAGQITETFNMPVTLTDISGGSGLGTFDYFQSAGAPGGSVLTSVRVRIYVDEALESLSVTNNDPTNPQNFRYLTFSNINTAGTAPAADKTGLKNALNANGGVNGDIDLYDTGVVSYGPGQTINYAPPPVLVPDDSLMINAASFAAYDTTGTFTLGFTTTTFQSFIGGGGNGSNSQVTDATATVQVEYNYSEVPEPASLSILGLGAVGLLRRRRA